MRRQFIDKFQCELSKIQKSKKPLTFGEVVISKNNSNNEILVAKPSNGKNTFIGYLFLQLIKLNLSNQSVVTEEDKIKIINFVQKYGIQMIQKI